MHRHSRARAIVGRLGGLGLPGLLVGLGLAACGGPEPVKVGQAHLALALGVEEVPPGELPVVEILPGQKPTIPDAPVIKLAIDRRATWGEVKAVLDTMQSRGQTAVPLVVERRKIKAFRLSEEVEGQAIEVTAHTDGKACVRHPDIPEAKCVQTVSKDYIDGAFTRELVREAVKGYGLTQVEVDLPPELTWGDVVRTVDGSRTCCMKQKILVEIRPPR